jgi:hypothetical protein
MSNKIFIIKNLTDDIGFYTDLEKAKNELKKIYNKNLGLKYYEYKINVYHLVDNEYKLTNVSYTYSFGNFSIIGVLNEKRCNNTINK